MAMSTRLQRLIPPAVMIAALAAILGATDLVAGDYLQRIVIIIGINVILVASLNLSNGLRGCSPWGTWGLWPSALMRLRS